MRNNFFYGIQYFNDEIVVAWQIFLIRTLSSYSLEWLMSEAIVIIKSISIFILNEPSERATSDCHLFSHILFLITKLYFSWEADFSKYLEEKDKSQVDAVEAFFDISYDAYAGNP